MSYPNKITSKIISVVEVSKQYTGGATEDIVVNVDNNADIITAAITDEAKQKFGKIDKITVNDVEQPISEKTVNIVVPTKEEIGSKLAISIDSNTFVMTVNLLNNQDQVLSSGTVDLPLETMVVGASYSNGTLTLALKNGQTLDVGISSLISGLVPETRTINGKPLTSDITLTAEDVGASSPTNMVTTDTEQTITGKKIFTNINITGNISDGTNEITIADIVGLKTQIGDIETLLASLNDGEGV